MSIPNIKGVISAVEEQIIADYDKPYVYRFKVKITKDINVLGDVKVTLNKSTQQGRGFIYFNGKSVNDYIVKSNEFIVDFLPLTDEDKIKPFKFDIILSANNAEPITLTINIKEPISLQSNAVYTAIGLTKEIVYINGEVNNLELVGNNDIVSFDKGKIIGKKPGKTVIGLSNGMCLATMAVEVIDYTPINGFIININGVNYNSLTDTINIKYGENLNINFRELLPYGNDIIIYTLDIAGVSKGSLFNNLEGEYFSNIDKNYKFDFLPTDQINKHKCYIGITYKIFNYYPRLHYTYTDKENQILKILGVRFNQYGNYIPIKWYN